MSPRAAAATVLLHAGLIAATLQPSQDNRQPTPAHPLEVRILPAIDSPAAAASLPAPTPLSPPLPAQAASPAPVKKRTRIESRADSKLAKPATGTSPRQEPATNTPQPAAETKPAIPAATPAAPPSPATAEPAARTASTAPAKTSASEAAYAASNRKPVYPRLSRANNEQGTVLLRVLVKADGTAGQVAIKASSGYPLLDKSASAAVQSWRFSPATVHGKPVDEWYEVPIPFKLVDD